MDQADLFYDERFLESWAGSIVTNPSIAIVELVANCWDAYATEVKATWGDRSLERHFSVIDNGVGMTKNEFLHIWKTMSYNRLAHGGSTITPPSGTSGFPRPVFGKNGKGRFAMFCFADAYTVTSRKDGQEFTCKVYRTPTNPLVIEELSFTESGVEGHGTEIRGTGDIRQLALSEEDARELLGGRFLANPAFRVFVNGRQVSFSDISDSSLSTIEVDVPEYGKIKIIHIDTKKADKTTKQHGIAWWVSNRAVGECRWSGSDVQRILDGRTNEAKRYTFIVQADFLNDAGAVKEDWSWFFEDNKAWLAVRTAAQEKIKEIINSSNKAERETKRQSVTDRLGKELNKLPPLSKDRVESFVAEVVNTCPNFGEQEIFHLSSILTKLEQSKSRYGLLEILHNQDPHDLDNLHEVLSQWTIGMAKIVLDEIQNRLKLIHELQAKIQVDRIDEVHELQPLFEKGLWMFGPQFESIEFTSNKGMTTVIRELFKDITTKGSKNRPDFVVLPDTSVGFYARSSYDDEYNENGIEHVVIVDLKTTRLALGSIEKDQVWRYVKELKQKGKIRESTKVDGFVLGTEIESGESECIKHGENVKIIPMLYDTILARAEKRLLNLYSKVKEAPFLEEQRKELDRFTNPVPTVQESLEV
jgi:hypothetical protein